MSSIVLTCCAVLNETLHLSIRRHQRINELLTADSKHLFRSCITFRIRLVQTLQNRLQDLQYVFKVSFDKGAILTGLKKMDMKHRSL